MDSHGDDALLLSNIVNNRNDAVIPEQGIDVDHTCRCEVSCKEGLRTTVLLLEGIAVFNDKTLVAILDVGLVLLDHDAFIS